MGSKTEKAEIKQQRKVQTEISEEKLLSYLSITDKALHKLELAKQKAENMAMAKDFLLMAKSYYSDARHYYKKGDFVTAFAAVNYAHGFIDAGARAGFFIVDNSDDIFAVDSRQKNNCMQKKRNRKDYCSGR